MLPAGYEKRSFLRFDIGVDLESLRQEFQSIPQQAWLTSYWNNVHCSVGMLLLIGGEQGNESDFYSDTSKEHELLDTLPYIKSLLVESGPFGSASYAFLFRMKPNGVTLKHQDLIEKWRSMYRIHVPIWTNSGAHLVAGGRSQHFAEGYAWSFDNHSDHGVVNGSQERTHLIFDIPFNEKLKARLDNADYLEGTTNPGTFKNN